MLEMEAEWSLLGDHDRADRWPFSVWYRLLRLDIDLSDREKSLMWDLGNW